MEQQKLKLDNVTLVAVDCVTPLGAIISMNKTCENMEFGRKIFFGDTKPKNIDDSIEYVQIKKLGNLVEYSKYMLCELPKYITTEYCLSVQEDGWVINTNNWRDEFLCDYIGAPWTYDSSRQNEELRVGNGGVSIRSKKLMDLLSNGRGFTGHEDTTIACSNRTFLENNGCKFAPLQLAKYFSMERPCSDLDVTWDEIFAFHGRVGLQQHIDKVKEMKDAINEIL